MLQQEDFAWFYVTADRHFSNSQVSLFTKICLNSFSNQILSWALTLLGCLEIMLWESVFSLFLLLKHGQAWRQFTWSPRWRREQVRRRQLGGGEGRGAVKVRPEFSESADYLMARSWARDNLTCATHKTSSFLALLQMLQRRAVLWWLLMIKSQVIYFFFDQHSS